MILFPNAKINLGLHITTKRKDGFHDIVSCLYPIGWQDVLEVVVAQKKTELKLSGIEIPGSTAKGVDKGNLVYRAYELLRKDYDLPPVQIHLHKLIPIGAGLGGGSADAAFMLKAVNEMFQLFLDDSILEDYASRLGSDCPFFIQNKPVLALERGDVFEAVQPKLQGYQLLVIKPPVPVSTAEAYAGVIPRAPEHNLSEILENSPVSAWRELLSNDFEQSIFSKYPQIQALKAQMYEAGALYASMSGSGSAVYGLFQDKVADLHLPESYLQWKGNL